MFLQAHIDNEATDRPLPKRHGATGFVMNLSRLWAWRPEVCEAFGALRTQLTGNSSSSNRGLAVIVCATATSLGDSYGALAWGNKLAAATDPSAAAAGL